MLQKVESEKARLGCMVKASGMGDEPRRVLDELSKINLVDVVLPTSTGVEIRKRCVTRPTEHQEILLQHLGLNLPRQIKNNFSIECSQDFLTSTS